MSEKVARARYELYNRWMEDPVNPELNEWWTELNPQVQDSISELHRRGRVFEQDQIKAVEVDDRKQSLVDEILSQDTINPDLFKTKIPRQLGVDAPDDMGLVKYNQAGGRDVVNDPKALNIMMMDDKMPYDMNPEEMGKWSADMQKKGEYEKQGYRLYNVSKNYVEEPPKKEKSVLDIVREPYVGQWQAWVNTFSRANKMRQRTSLMKDLFEQIGHNPEESIKRMAQLNAEIKGIPTSEAYAMFNDPTVSWDETLKRLGTDPIEIVAQGVTESMVQFLPSWAYNAFWKGLQFGGAYATVGGISTVGAGAIPAGLTGVGHGVITASGITSYNMEYTGKILESLEEAGIDITNANSLAYAFQDEELMSEVKALAVKKAVPIAVVDMVSGGIAGTLAGKFKSKAVGGAVELATQAGLGGFGEAISQPISGEEFNLPAIVMEAVAEPGQAMPVGMVRMGIAQNESVKQAKFNKTAVGQEILKAREESSFDKATIDMAEKLVKQNTEAFEDKSVLQFIDEVKTITDAELQERGLDPAEFKRGEGVDPATGTLRALGSTEVENGQVIIKLYQGARPADVIEEFYGNHFRRLSPENRKVWQAYYQQAKDAGEVLTEQEYFEKQGQMFYFGYNLASDKKVVQIFRKIKFYMDDMFNKASIAPEIRKMYEDAGFGRLERLDAEDGDVSFSVAPIWYNKSSEAVDKLNVASLKARGVRNYFKRQGVSKEEMQAIKLDEFLTQFKPTDRVPVMQLKEHIMRNELQLTDWGTIEEVYEKQKQEQAEALAKVDAPRELTEEEWEDFYENEAEYEYPEEQRYDVVQYGDSWRDLDMYGDQTPGFEYESDAERAIEEEVDYLMESAFDELESGNDSWRTIVEEETDDLETFPEGKKYHIYDGEYDPTPVETDQPLGFSTPEVPQIDPERILYTDDSIDGLREQFFENERETYEGELEIESFTWVDEDAEPEVINMPDQPPKAKPIERIKPRWGSGGQVQPGGKDYQELIIRLDKQGKRIYSSGHFNVDNPLVHMRFNTREDKDGNKVLFVEEIQSDWHQEGAKRGYGKQFEDSVRKDENVWVVYSKEGWFVDVPVSEANTEQEAKSYAENHPELKKNQTHKMGVADAPYKDFGWISLAGKRLFKYAVDNGFDKIAWVTGKQQVDRNNLRKYIDKIEYSYDSDDDIYLVKAYGKDGRNVLDRTLEEEELEQYVGKAVARRIVEGKGSYVGQLLQMHENLEDAQENLDTMQKKWLEDRAEGTKPLNLEIEEVTPYHRKEFDNIAPHHNYILKRYQANSEKYLAGLDLEVGGENRIKLYDTEIPNRMKKLVKGQSKLGTTQLQTEKASKVDWLNKESDIENAVEAYDAEVSRKEFININSNEGHLALEAIPDLLTQRNLTPEQFNGMSKNARLNILFDHLKSTEPTVEHQSIDITPAVKEKYSKPMPSFSLVPAQKEFFKDTKVVDDKGNPKVVYHGTATKSEFTKFIRGDIGHHFGSREASNARVKHLSELRDEVEASGGAIEQYERPRVIPVYLNIKNPLVAKVDAEHWNEVDRVAEALDTEDSPLTHDEMQDMEDVYTIREALQAHGYDGIVYENEFEDVGSTSYIAFSPEQIKSVFNRKPAETGESFSVVPEEEAQNFNQNDYKFFGEGDLLVPISTRLKRIHPTLKKALRDFEFKNIKYSRDDRKRVKPFLDKFLELANNNSEEFTKLDSALKNGKGDEAYTVALENGLEEEFNAVTEYLDEMHQRLKDAGVDVGWVDDYFPRRVTDYDGLLAHFNRQDQGLIQKALDKEKVRLGVLVLSEDEKAHVVNRLITGSKTLGKKSPHIERRNNKIVIDAKINEFYQDSPATLLNYIDSMNEMIAEREFFGKGENRTKSIGAYVSKLVDEGKILPAQQEEVIKIFRSRFDHRGSGWKTALVKNIGYGMTMGSPTSAITQIGDLAWSIYMAGLGKTLKHAGKALTAEFGKDTGQITPEDMGTEKIAQDFENTSTAGVVLDKIFTATGLKSIDRIGKTTLVNATIERYQSRAKDGDASLKAELEPVFEGETDQVIKDLKSGKVTDNVQMLAFNTLLDFQPVALSEMPIAYLDNPTGRIFYQLKTFTIKQFDVFRNQAFDKMRTATKRDGKKFTITNKKLFKEGMGNLIKLSIAFASANATGDILKDLLMGRPIHANDIIWDNIWRLMGVSRYHAWQARERGIGVAGQKLLLHPVLFSIVDQLQMDMFDKLGDAVLDPDKSIPETAMDMRSLTFVPIVGKPLYWRFGGGTKKINSQERRRFRDARKERGLTRSETLRYNKLADEALAEGWISYGTWKNIVIKGK